MCQSLKRLFVTVLGGAVLLLASLCPAADVDLLLHSLSVTRPATPSSRTFTACSFKLYNYGPDTLADTVLVEYYLSSDTTFGNADDRKIGDTVSSVTLNAGYTWSASLSATGLTNMVDEWTMDLVASGNYYVYAKASCGTATELDPADNTARTALTFSYTRNQVDLSLSSLSVTRPADISSRSFTACSVSVYNYGPALSSGTVKVEYYLSDDTVFGDADDKRIGESNFSSVSILASATRTFTLSATGLAHMAADWTEGLVGAGNYYVYGVVSCGTAYETDPSDNRNRTAATFQYSPPIADLSLTGLSASRPASLSARTFTSCAFTLVNGGPMPLSAETVMVDYYLSANPTFGDGDDVMIGDTSFSITLAVGASTSISLSATGLANMADLWTPALVGLGNYYLFASARVFDGSPSDPTSANNTSSWGLFGYDPNTYCTVTFDADGGTVSPVSKTVIVGSTYGALPTPSKANAAFGGWWTGVGGTGTQITSGSTVSVAANHTLYAKWTAVYTLTVIGGTGSGVYPVGSVVPVSTSVPAGQAFVRWDIESDDWESQFAHAIVADETAAATTVHMPGGNTVLTPVTAPFKTIASLAELLLIGNDAAYPLSGAYLLTADINASATVGWNGGLGWQPIGGTSASFTGLFDGGGHTISGLTVNRPLQDGVGLFKETLYPAVIRNLNVESGVVVGNNRVGALAGENGDGIIRNCRSQGSVIGYGYDVGGLIGQNHGVIGGCAAEGDVTGADCVGGLVGYNCCGFILNSHADADIVGDNVAGGLVGHNGRLIQGCFATGLVEGTGTPEYMVAGSNFGGLAGENFDEVSECYAAGHVLGGVLSTSVGGLVGNNLGFILRSYAVGRAEGCTDVGRLVGCNQSGFTGWGYIEACYAANTSDVYCEIPAPGLTGENNGAIGGSYWDYVAGAWGGGALDATARTTTQMRQAANYAGWDFDGPWGIDEGYDYPYLKACPVYALDFDAQGGTTALSARHFNPGQLFGALPRPVRAGFAFGGWWTGVGGSGEQVSAGSVAPFGDLTLFAKWTPQTVPEMLADVLDCTELTWSTSGASAWFGQVDETHDGMDAAQSGVLTHGQTNWIQTTVSGPGILRYWWKVSSEAGWDKLIFYYDGKAQAGPLSGTTNTWTRKGWNIPAGSHVVRWAYAKDRTESHGMDCGWVDQVEWFPIMTVAFNAQGGTVSPQSQSATVGMTYGALPTPVRNGYTFSGWWTEPDGNGLQMTAASTVLAQYTVLYAYWVGKLYTVTFDPEGGTVDPVTASVRFGSPYGDLPVPEKNGYVFQGWWSGDNGTGTAVTSETLVARAADHKLYAKWVAIPKLTLTNGWIEEADWYWDYVLPGEFRNVFAFDVDGKVFEKWTVSPATANLGGDFNARLPYTTVAMPWVNVALTAVYVTAPGYLAVSAEAVNSLDVVSGLLWSVDNVTWTPVNDGIFYPLKPGNYSLSFRSVNPNWLAPSTRTVTIVTGAETGANVMATYVPVVSWQLAEECAAGSGTVAMTPANGQVLPGKSVTLTAKPATGHVFVGWHRDYLESLPEGAERNPTLTVAPTENTTYFARFRAKVLCEAPEVWFDEAAPCMVGVPYSQVVEINDGALPVTFTATSLPTGLKIDPVTGAITGIPTTAGAYWATVRAVNANGASMSMSGLIIVEALPTWAQGSFNGRSWTEELGQGVAAMSVSAQGKVSGKITLAGTNYLFAAASYESRTEDNQFWLSATATVGTVKFPMTLNVRAPELWSEAQIRPTTLGIADGLLGETGFVEMWRNVWSEPAMATVLTNRFTGYYTATLPGQGDCGSGYLAFTVDKTGGVKTAGKLADGTPVTLSGALVLNEAGLLMTVVYAAPALYKGGGFFGMVEFLSQDGLPAVVRLFNEWPFLWENRNPMATGQYGGGFTRELGLSGGLYSPLINLWAYYANGLAVSGVTLPSMLAVTKFTDWNEFGTGKITWSDTNQIAASEEASPNGITVNVTPSVGIGTGLSAPLADMPERLPDGWYSYGVDSNGDGFSNTAGLTILFTRATGIFRGTFKVWFDYLAAEDFTLGTYTVSHTSKLVNYEGLLTPARADGNVEGRGFYLWADKGSYLNAWGSAVSYTFNWSFDFLLLAN